MPAGLNDVRAGGAYVEIGTDDKPLVSGLSSIRQRLSGFVAGIGDLGKKMMIAGGILGAPLVLAIKKASDLEETASKFRAVFKNLSGPAGEWVRELSKAVGRGQGDLMKYMATLQDTFVPIGIARDKAAELSLQITKLAIDLASFNNVADAEVIELLQSAIVGSHRAVRRFGIVLSETSLKAELLRMGITGGTDAATEQQKAIARLNIIMGSSKDALGDAIRTSDSFANQMKRLRAWTNDLAETVGQKLIPITKPYVKMAADLVLKFQQWVRQNGALVQSFGRFVAILFVVGSGLVFVSKGLSAIWDIFKTAAILIPILALAEALGLIPQSLKDIVSEAKIGKQTLKEWIEPMRAALVAFWEKIKETKLGIIDLLKLLGDVAVAVFLDTLTKITSVLDSWIKAILGPKLAGMMSGLGMDFQAGVTSLEQTSGDAWAVAGAGAKKWFGDRKVELSILADGVKKTFTVDREVFEEMKKAVGFAQEYNEEITNAKKFGTMPGTFNSFRVAGVAAGGVSKALNDIAGNTLAISKAAAKIVENTKDPVARAGE